jgi:outer membrane receptor protein involved in Fe transport
MPPVSDSCPGWHGWRSPGGTSDSREHGRRERALDTASRPAASPDPSDAHVDRRANAIRQLCGVVLHVADVDELVLQLRQRTVAGLGVDVRLDRGVTVFLRGNNITETEYDSVLGYPGLPRTFMGGVRFGLR